MNDLLSFAGRREIAHALILVCLGQGLDPLAVGGAHDGTGEEHAFVEMVTSRETLFVQEPFRLRLRFGVDRQFLRDHMVQLFRRSLDVPVQLSAPWIGDLPGAVPQDGGAGESLGGSEAKVRSFALNEGVAEAAELEDRRMDGRTFIVLEIERSYLPTRPGELSIPAPILRFAYASRFQEDFIDPRVALDRQEVSMWGQPLILRIQPLPEQGRPLEFTGAVGRFSVRAESDAQVLGVGESLGLSLRIEGEGNLESFASPRLAWLEGFHVRGQIEGRSGTCRTVTYDLAPLGEDVNAVPSIAFAFFDPSPPAGYRTVWTRPIPLRVRARPRAGAERALSPTRISIVMFLVGLVALGLLHRLPARGSGRGE